MTSNEPWKIQTEFSVADQEYFVFILKLFILFVNS